MDDTTRRQWELIADQCFDRAYRAAQRAVTVKPANGKVPGPRKKPQP